LAAVPCWLHRAWLAVELLCTAEACGEPDSAVEIRAFMARSAQEPLLGNSLDRCEEFPSEEHIGVLLGHVTRAAFAGSHLLQGSAS
jgi:hypothetical protein